jgi:hypothetical protein
MGWRIHMGAVLADHLVEGRTESVLEDGVRLVRLRIGGRRHLRLAEPGPHRRIGSEAVGEIDEGLAGEDTVDAVEIVRCSLRDEKPDADGGKSRRQEAVAKPKWTNHLSTPIQADRAGSSGWGAVSETAAPRE